jgi:hypothetical protein
MAEAGLKRRYFQIKGGRRARPLAWLAPDSAANPLPFLE